MIKKLFILLISSSSISLYGQIQTIKMMIIDNNGLGALDMLLIDRTKSNEEYFDVIIQKNGFASIDTIDAKNYQLIIGKDNDKVRFYDKQFIIGDFFLFSNKNLKVNKDSTVFILTNKNRVTKDSKGLSVRNKDSNMEIVISVPIGFQITKSKTNTRSIIMTKKDKTISFSGNDIKTMIYEIEYKKIEVDTIYSALGKKEICRKQMSIDKKKYQIEIWDDELEDGDIINVYFNSNLVIHNYSVHKTPITLPLDLTNVKKEKLMIQFENVSEGKIKPNTVFFRIFGNGIDETIDLTTTKKINSFIEFSINH